MELSSRNQRTINHLLKQVFHQRRAVIAKWSITEAYGQATFSITIRRDLRKRWDDLLDDMESEARPILRLAELHGDIILTRADNYWPDEEE